MLNTSLEESLQGNETRYCTIEHVKYRSLQLSGSHEAWPGCSEPTCERAGAHSDRNSHPSLNSWVGGSLCSGSEGSPWVCARSLSRTVSDLPQSQNCPSLAVLDSSGHKVKWAQQLFRCGMSKTRTNRGGEKAQVIK